MGEAEVGDALANPYSSTVSEAAAVGKPLRHPAAFADTGDMSNA